MAMGAEVGGFDVLFSDAGVEQLDFVCLDKVKIPVVFSPDKDFFGFGQGPAHDLDNIRLNLVAAGTDCRTDAHPEVFRFEVELLFQCPDRFLCDAGDGAFPAGMGNADCPFLRVEEEERNTVGNKDEEADAGFVGDKTVGGGRGRTFFPDEGDIGAVDLFAVD